MTDLVEGVPKTWMHSAPQSLCSAMAGLHRVGALAEDAAKRHPEASEAFKNIEFIVVDALQEIRSHREKEVA